MESIQKAVESIEAQLASVKKSLEGIQPPAGSNANGDAQAMREQMRQRTEAIQKAAEVINEQVLVLKGRLARTEFESEMTELQSIAASAKTEQATKTEQRMQSFIDARRKVFQEKAERLQIPAAPRRGGSGRGPGLEAQEAPNR